MQIRTDLRRLPLLAFLAAASLVAQSVESPNQAAQGAGGSASIFDSNGNALYSNSGALNVNLASSVPVTGTFWQTTQPVSWSAQSVGLTAGTNVVGKFGIDQTTPGTTNGVQVTNSSIPVTGTFWQATQPVSWSAQSVGLVPSTSSTAATSPCYQTGLTTTATCKASAGNVYGWDFYNPNASYCTVDVFNTASPTLGTTTPVMTIPLPPSGVANIEKPFGVNFSTAISIAAVTATKGSTICTTAVQGELFYQ